MEPEEDYAHVMAVDTDWYNRIRIRKTLRVAAAMSARLSGTVMERSAIVGTMDGAATVTKRGRSKKAVVENQTETPPPAGAS